MIHVEDKNIDIFNAHNYNTKREDLKSFWMMWPAAVSRLLSHHCGIQASSVATSISLQKGRTDCMFTVLNYSTILALPCPAGNQIIPFLDANPESDDRDQADHAYAFLCCCLD